jgi:hypothetical protein
VFLLQHGIVAAHLVLPELSGFAVATELGRTLPGPCSPAALRQAAAPHLSGLLDAAFELALGSLQRARSEAALGALRTLLLEATRLQRRRRGEVLRAPMLTALVAGRERRLTLLELERVSRDGALWAIEPATDPSRVLLPDAPVLILGAGDRSRLGETLGLAFRTPPERPPAERRSLREWVENVLDALRRGVAALRPRRAVPPAEQRPEERALIGALSRLPGLGRAVLVDGDGPAHRRGATWRLPRASRLVVAAGRALARDPAWSGAAALALLPGSSTLVRSLIATGRAVPAPAETTPRPSRP